MLTYAKAGGPPVFWQGLRIVDLATDKEVRDVIEVNAAEGWLVRVKRDDVGDFIVNGDEVVTERIEGSFRIDDPSGLAEKYQ